MTFMWILCSRNDLGFLLDCNLASSGRHEIVAKS